MMPTTSALLFLAALSTAQANVAQSNPLGKVVDLLKELSDKVTKEGEAEAKAFKEYTEWCDDVTTEKGFEIKTAKSSKEALEANIAKLTGDLEAMESKIGALAADIASGSADLKSATTIRDGEVADFTSSEKELTEVIDTLGRAHTVLEREMRKKNTAFTQLASKDLTGLLRSMDTLAEAAALDVTDKQRLTALIQSQSNEDDEELGAPAAAVYESHAGSILDTIEDLKEKAEDQLSAVRKAEVNAKHNYAMVKQSLEDQRATDSKDLDAEKADKAAASESKAVDEGDLKTTIADLKEAEDTLASTQASCAEVSANHEGTVAARNEELKVISEAMGILENTTGAAVNQAYSFLQAGARSGLRMQTRADLAKSEVLTLIKKLAQRQQSTQLTQLAGRIAAVMRSSAGSSEGPFDKVKALIKDMVARLEKEAGADATEKAFCDEELAKSDAQKGELDATISKLTTKLDQHTARSDKLKAEVTELSAELAKLAKEEAEANKIRQDAHTDFVQAKADYEQGLTGVRQALVTLRDYYAKEESAAFIQDGQPAKPKGFEKGAGAGTSIIGILEVVESDFATNLAKEETAEATAQEAFEKMVQENKITRATKEKDIEYKTQEATSTDKTITELSSDRETTNTEQAAVLEYLEKLHARCDAKPESYESRKNDRAAEIAGLKEALTVLEQETAFVQRKSRRMRGSLHGVIAA